MIYYSRRQLAKYAVDELENGRSYADLAKRLAGALIIANRRQQADFLLADIERELEERGLSAVAKVTSAHPIGSTLSAQLKKQLMRKASVKEVNLVSEIDKNVLGGLKVETASKSWDYTVSTRLRQIKESI